MKNAVVGSLVVGLLALAVLAPRGFTISRRPGPLAFKLGTLPGTGRHYLIAGPRMILWQQRF
jgi:hypothetical protein